MVQRRRVAGALRSIHDVQLLVEMVMQLLYQRVVPRAERIVLVEQPVGLKVRQAPDLHRYFVQVTPDGGRESVYLWRRRRERHHRGPARTPRRPMAAREGPSTPDAGAPSS